MTTITRLPPRYYLVHIFHMSVHNHFYYSNQCKTNKHSSLQFHCFNMFNVAPSPGIALISVCELSGRAVQPVDSFPQMSVEPGAEVRGSTPAATPAPSSRPSQLPSTDDLSGSLPKQYCGRCTLIRIAIPNPIFPRP